MKEYSSMDSIRNRWYTVEDLKLVLEDQGYGTTDDSILQWERKGIIPKATRVKMRGRQWRVYEKDGSDFERILEALSKKDRKHVV